MSSRSSVRFAFNIDGSPRNILSVGQKACGDLILNLKPSKQFRDVDSLDGKDDVIEQRYSIHASTQSKDGIDVIKQTLKLANGEIINTRHYTTAMKAGNSFAPIFIRRCPNLSIERYKITNQKAKIIKLADYDHNLFMPIFMVMVSRFNREFVLPSFDNYSLTQHEFSLFRLVIIWCFLGPILPHHTGELVHVITIPPSKLAAMVHPKGMNEIECIDFFKKYREVLKINFLKLVTMNDHQLLNDAIKFTDFFREGNENNQEYNKYISLLKNNHMA